MDERKFLEALEEFSLVCKRMDYTVAQLQKELRVRLNVKFEIVEPTK